MFHHRRAWNRKLDNFIKPLPCQGITINIQICIQAPSDFDYCFDSWLHFHPNSKTNELKSFQICADSLACALRRRSPYRYGFQRVRVNTMSINSRHSWMSLLELCAWSTHHRMCIDCGCGNFRSRFIFVAFPIPQWIPFTVAGILRTTNAHDSFFLRTCRIPDMIARHAWQATSISIDRSKRVQWCIESRYLLYLHRLQKFCGNDLNSGRMCSACTRTQYIPLSRWIKLMQNVSFSGNV